MWGPQGWKHWGVQPAMFNDVPHEQIDWAELAKQWIQMQQTSSPMESAPPPPPPLPLQAPPQVALPPPPGHLPPGGEAFPSPSVPHGKVSPEPFRDSMPYDEKPDFVSKTQDGSFWNKSQWDTGPPGDADHRLWAAPPMDPTPPIIGGKETFDYGHMHDNPPLAMQSIDYNHMSDYSYSPVYGGPSTPTNNQYDQYWTQVNASSSTISPMFLKKERASSLKVEEESPALDAAKRKTLPAWIREGLEKMEQERLKKMERENAASKKPPAQIESNNKEEPNPIPLRSKFESESEEEIEEEEVPVKQIIPPKKRAPTPEEDMRTEEEKKQELIFRVRRLLTEILLSVTNSEMVAIAQEMYRKAKTKAPARQLATTAPLTAIASGLSGLASYGTESEASEDEAETGTDSEEELYRKIREKKRLFAVTEKKILADLERKENEQKEELEKPKNGNNLTSADKDNMEKTDSHSSELKNNENSEPSTLVPNSSSNSIQFNSNAAEVNKLEVAEKAEPAPNENNTTSSSDSSSSSSDSSSESNDKEKRKKQRDKKSHDSKKTSKRSKSPTKYSSRHRRSNSSEVHKSSDKKSNKKKKKYKRSESSSSSDSTSHHRRQSNKSSSRSHRDRRSRSWDDRERKRRRSSSPSRSHRKSDSHSHRSFRYYEDERYERKNKDRDEKSHRSSRRSPSPHHKVPKKYRTSRSLSSESERSGKKSKKSRNRY